MEGQELEIIWEKIYKMEMMLWDLFSMKGYFWLAN